MAVFAYQVVSHNRVERGTIRADSPQQAREQLRAQGLRVRQLSPLQGNGNSSGRRQAWTMEGRPEAKVTSFAQELATLIGAGVPMLQALDAVGTQYHGRFGSSLLLVREQIAAGMSLADAMRQQPHIFDELCVSMVEVGERTGMLDQVLNQLAAYRRRHEQLKGRIGTAMIYPILVGCAGVGVTVFLCTFVVPKLLETLIESGRPLPLTTQIVKGFSDLLLAYGWLIGLVGLAVAILAAVALRRPRVQWKWHQLQLHLPLVGKLVRLQAVVRVAVMLATLTRSGMEFVQALGLVANTMPNRVLQDALRQCQHAISAGRDIGPALAATGAFPEPVIRIMEVGQATGHLDLMLDRLALDYDQQVQMATSRLVAVLEPVMILLLAGFIGFIVLSVILPYLEAGNVL